MLKTEALQEFLLSFTQEIMERSEPDEILAKAASVLAENGFFSEVTISLYDRLYDPSGPAKRTISRTISLTLRDSSDSSDPKRTSRSSTSFSMPVSLRDREMGQVELTPKDENFALSQEEFRHYQLIINIAGIAINQARIQQDLMTLSIQDDLTGCYNRRYLIQDLQSKISWAKRYDRTFSLVIADIDDFKNVNDEYGHLVGDSVLQQFGEMLRQNVRSADLVFRYGGDEFAIILPETNHEQAHKMIERMRAVIEKFNFRVGKKRIKLYVSIGVATFGADADELDALMDAADRACYQDKALRESK